jgi:hypothetical protein
MLKEMSDGKDNYTCPICHEFTSYDEWANDYSCIDCAVINTDSSNFFIDNHIK